MVSLSNSIGLKIAVSQCMKWKYLNNVELNTLWQYGLESFGKYCSE